MAPHFLLHHQIMKPLVSTSLFAPVWMGLQFFQISCILEISWLVEGLIESNIEIYLHCTTRNDLL